MICAKRKVLYILLLAAVILLGLSLVLFIGCGNNDDNGSRGGETSGPKDPIPPVAVITVTLDARGGGSYDALKYTTAALVLPVPQRENFEFTGWFESADCSGTAVSSSAYVPSRNVTLYAGWAKETMPPTPPDPPDPERYAWHDDSFDKNGIGDAAVFTANNGNYSTLKYCVSETDDSAAVYKLSEYNTISFEYSPGAAAEHNTDFSVLRLAVKNAAGEVFRFAIANKNNSVVFDKDGLNIAGSGFVNGNHGVGEWGSGEEWYSVECSLAANNVIITVDGDPYTWDYTQGMDLSGELEWYFETEFCLPSIRNIVFSEVDIRDMPEPAFKHNGYDKTSENGDDVYTASTVDLRAADLPKPDGVVNTFEFSVRPNVLPDGCWDQNYVAFAACFDDYSLLFQFLNYYKLIWVRPFEHNATGNAIVEARYVDANEFVPGWNGYEEWYDITVRFTDEEIEIYVNGVLRGEVQDHGYKFDPDTRYAIWGYNNLSSVKGLRLFNADKNDTAAKEALRAYINTLDIDGIDETAYTPESFIAFTAALDSAYDALGKTNISAEETASALETLKTKLSELEYAPEKLVPELQARLDRAAAVYNEEYTADSVSVLSASVTEGNALINDGTATSEQILASIDKLDAALNGLVRVWETASFDRTRENGTLVYTPKTATAVSTIGNKSDLSVIDTIEFSYRPNAYANVWDQGYIGVSINLPDGSELLITILHFYKLIWVRPMTGGNVGNSVCTYPDENPRTVDNYDAAVHNGWTDTDTWFAVKISVTEKMIDIYIDGTLRGRADLSGTSYSVPSNATVDIISYAAASSVKDLRAYKAQ